MENKCNKTPNSGNNTNKYMDHVYCHSNQTKNSYISSNPGGVGGGGAAAAASPNADILALLKENKQLKAMLILHLDLIQEQSDQLMAKEKVLISRNEEIETLRTNNVLLDNQVKELQKQLQQQIKRSGEISTLPPPPLAKIQCKTNQSTMPVPSSVNSVTTNCAKIISTPASGKSNIIGECNGKLISKIVLQRVSISSGRGKRNQSPHSHTTDTENEEEAEEDEENDDDEEEEEEEDVEDEGEDEGLDDEEGEAEENHQDENPEQEDEEIVNLDASEEQVVEHFPDSVDEKSNTQTIIIDEFYDTGNTTEDSNEVLAVQSKRLRLRQAAKQSLAIPRGAKPSISPASTTTSDGQTAFKAVNSSASTTSKNLAKQPLTPSRGKQMTIMRWHAPDYNTDESVSCDSTADNERRSATTATSSLKPSTYVAEKKRSHDNSSQQLPHHHRQKVRKCAYISTPHLYSTREWEEEAFACDNDHEFLKAEAKILQAANPKLEIPKWTEHELTPSYCIEGTEDLSDETFLKRHSKLEVDEKRRKKWDVQQIREQRRIERLKRRHCKDEIQPTQDTNTSLQTFYPTTESLQSIYYVNDLPVQAFGEMIPRLTATIGSQEEIRKGFQLPWLDKEHIKYLHDNNKPPTVATINSSETTLTASLQMQQQMLNSAFVFLKKRRRQQSSSFAVMQQQQQHTPRNRNQASKLTNVNNCSNTITAASPSSNTNTNQTSFLNLVKSTTAATSSTLTTTTSTSLTTTTTSARPSSHGALSHISELVTSNQFKVISNISK